MNIFGLWHSFDTSSLQYKKLGITLSYPSQLGGLLAHGAVCAREHGIPCVVNIPGVCGEIQTGDIVELDGAVGTLKVLDAASSSSSSSS